MNSAGDSDSDRRKRIYRQQNIFEFSGRGEVFSYTTVNNPPEGYQESAPYTVALVKLEEGPLITAQLTDVENDDVKIGLPVEMVTRKLRTYGDEGLIIYGYKFRPRLALNGSS